MSLIRNRHNDNIVVAKGHGYTVEKVRKAMEFLDTSNRFTTLQEWVDVYNFIRNTNETATGCKSCQAAKYTASVRNYAKYGYMTLINEGHKPEEFGIGTKEDEIKPVENAENRIVTSVKTPEAVTEEVKEAVEETDNAETVKKSEEPVEEKPKKTSRKKK